MFISIRILQDKSGFFIDDSSDNDFVPIPVDDEKSFEFSEQASCFVIDFLI